jgi:hypothetical protein
LSGDFRNPEPGNFIRKAIKGKNHMLLASAAVPRVLLISSPIIIAAIIGFVFFNKNQFFRGVAGQVVHGLLSIVCFALVGVAFWRFGWKVGVIDVALLFMASNIGLTFHRYL